MQAPQTISTPAPARNRGDGERDQLEQDLRELIKDAARGKTIEDGIDIVLAQLDQMPHLNAIFRQSYAQELLYAARANLRNQITRQSEWTIPENMLRLNSERIAARISAYDYPLPGANVRLGDATVEDLTTAAEYHDGRAAGEAARAQLYRHIGAMLKKSKQRTVRQGVPVAKLDEALRGAQ